MSTTPTKKGASEGLQADAPDGGLRRGRVAERERQASAFKLALQGLPYDVIAERLGYSHRSAAWKAAQAFLDRKTSAEVDSLRDLELARLDALQAAHWIDATDGRNLRAAEFVLRLGVQRGKLLGLEQSPKVATETAMNTIVVPGDPEGYLSALKSISQGLAS